MMPDFADAYDTSLPGPAFSNASEADAWMFTWCGTCTKSSGTFDGCALTDVAAMGRIPAAWLEVDTRTANNKFICQCWTPAAGYIDLLGEVRAAR